MNYFKSYIVGLLIYYFGVYDLLKTLEKDVSKDVVLKLHTLVLSLFLNNGFISDNFRWVGDIPKGNHLLHMYV
jgi:hypothetical protein